MVHVYLNKFRKGGVVYRYLVVAEYDPATKRKRVLARIRDTDLLRILVEAGVVRGVGFEPTQAYAIGSSARPLWPGSGTPAPINHQNPKGGIRVTRTRLL